MKIAHEIETFDLTQENVKAFWQNGRHIERTSI